MSISANDGVFKVRDARVFRRCNFTCVYCGFDGRPFDGWMQLSIDHVIPRSSQGPDEEANLVAACRSCNSITSRMQFATNTTWEEIIQAKRDRVAAARSFSLKLWMEAVAPYTLGRPPHDVSHVKFLPIAPPQ